MPFVCTLTLGEYGLKFAMNVPVEPVVATSVSLPPLLLVPPPHAASTVTASTTAAAIENGLIEPRRALIGRIPFSKQLGHNGVGGIQALNR